MQRQLPAASAVTQISSRPSGETPKLAAQEPARTP